MTTTEAPKKKRLTGEERRKAVEAVAGLYRAGKSVREIRDERDLSYGLVHRLLSESGVEMRPVGGQVKR